MATLFGNLSWLPRPPVEGQARVYNSVYHALTWSQVFTWVMGAGWVQRWCPQSSTSPVKHLVHSSPQTSVEMIGTSKVILSWSPKLSFTGNIPISVMNFLDALRELQKREEGSFHVHPGCWRRRSYKIQRLWWKDVPQARREIRMEQGGPEAGLVKLKADQPSAHLWGPPWHSARGCPASRRHCQRPQIRFSVVRGIWLPVVTEQINNWENWNP